MKKNLFVLLLAMMCCMPAFAQKKSKKSAQPAPQPTMITFVAADNEEFILHFNGTRVNKEPQKRVEVRADMAKLNEEYNVRVVIKTPRLGSDMAFTTLTLDKQGEEYVVWANVKYDRAEVLSRECYRERRMTPMPIPGLVPPKKTIEKKFVPMKVDQDTVTPDNVITIEKRQ